MFKVFLCQPLCLPACKSTARGVLGVFQWCGNLELTRAFTNRGYRSIMVSGQHYRMVRVCSNGNLTWRCTTSGCPSRLHTDKDVVKIVKVGGPHRHGQQLQSFRSVRKTIKPNRRIQAGDAPDEQPPPPPDGAAADVSAAQVITKIEHVMTYPDEAGDGDATMNTSDMGGDSTMNITEMGEATMNISEMGEATGEDGGGTREIVVEIHNAPIDMPDTGTIMPDTGTVE